MGMFDGFWLRNRTASPQDRGTMTAGQAGADAKAGDAFDEFGAPEGGFGRLDMLLDELKAVASPPAGQPVKASLVTDCAVVAPAATVS